MPSAAQRSPVRCGASGSSALHVLTCVNITGITRARVDKWVGYYTSHSHSRLRTAPVARQAGSRHT